MQSTLPLERCARDWGYDSLSQLTVAVRSFKATLLARSVASKQFVPFSSKAHELPSVLLSASKNTVAQLDVGDSNGACMVHVLKPICYKVSKALV
jgi:hypothetical protein